MDGKTLVEFRATKWLSSWAHAKGGRVESTYGDKPTTKIAGPTILKDGDRVEMSAGDFAWCRATYPMNFFEASSAKAKKAPEPAPEPEPAVRPSPYRRARKAAIATSEEDSED